MSVTTPRVQSSATVVASPAAAAETVICQINGISTPGPGSAVVLSSSVSITIGTSGATLQLRIRRGTTTAGTLVADSGTTTVTAGNTRTHSLDGIDLPNEVAGQSYVLTAQVASASAASTVKAVGLTALY